MAGLDNIQNALSLYATGSASGIVATPAAADEVFQFRNPSASVLAIVESVIISMSNAAAVTLAQEFGWNLHLCTAWTADGTGGTALAPNKRRQVNPTAAVASTGLRISTTAALGAGTKTIATEAFATGPGPSLNAIGASGPVTVLGGPGVTLMILGDDEGFTVRNRVTYADGSARFHVHVLWHEVGL